MPYESVTKRVDHSKKCSMFQTKFGSNMDKPICWVKNVIKKCTVESESWSWGSNLNF